MVLLVQASLGWTVGWAVGFYTPPCNVELETKDKALNDLNRCLKREGRPPFDEQSEQKKSTICEREMDKYNLTVNAYRVCLIRPHARS